MSNREIDFGFGRGAVRACVRAKLCAGVRTMSPPGLGRNIGSLWGSGPCRAVPYWNAVLRDLHCHHEDT